MDDWSPEQQRHRNKRTFTQMSELLQPLRNQNPFIASSPHPLPHPSTFASISSFNMPPRVGHPQHLSYSNPPENMAHRRLPMPSLQHQASRTVIDLTEEADPPSSQSQPRRSSQRPAAPPQLERSDSISLGQEVITIDSDDDDEVEFVSQQPLPGARQGIRPVGPPALRQNHLQQMRQSQHHPGMAPGPHRHEPFFAAFGGMNVLRGINMRQAIQNYMPAAAVLRLGDGPQRGPNMPGEMDYGGHPFMRVEPPKDEFQPPPPAREGFTRSPKEDDVVVCPACDEELAVDPMDTEPGPEKKPSKRKSKADRAEHPFWVVRECGHVYCNKCYQHRKGDAKNPTKFPVAPGRRGPVCAVDGCNQDVADKKQWVGVFL